MKRGEAGGRQEGEVPGGEATEDVALAQLVCYNASMKSRNLLAKYSLKAGHKTFNYVNTVSGHLPVSLANILREAGALVFGPVSDTLPLNLAVEPTNICNLKCPLCPTSQVMKRKKGVMRYEDFKFIVDDIAGFVKRIDMSFAGEPLLCPDALKMVRYAESQGIEVYLDTNGTVDRTEEIIESKLSHIDISLDGASKETYERYRVGARFAEVKENIRRLASAKKRRKLDKPRIIMQFVVFKHNEKEVPAMVKLAKELGVDTLLLKSAALNCQALGLNREEVAQKYLPEEQKYRRFYLRDGRPCLRIRRLCEWAFGGVILYNGDVTTCCYDQDGKYKVSNVFREGGFRKIWRSRQHRRVRRAILKRALPLCQTCSYVGDTTIARINT